MLQITTAIAILLTAASVSFLYSLSAIIELHKLAAPIRAPAISSKNLHEKGPAVRSGLSKPCKIWVIVPNATGPTFVKINRLLSIRDLCLVMTLPYGSGSGTAKCSTPKCVAFLQQPPKDAGIRITNSIWPYDYAIRHGARFILTLNEAMPLHFLEKAIRDLAGRKRSEWDLDGGMVLENDTDGSVLLNRLTLSSPMQDTSYRLHDTIRKSGISHFYPTPDPTQPPFALGHRVYTSFDDAIAVFNSSAYWALIALSDPYLQSFWTHRLLREIRQHAVVIPLTRPDKSDELPGRKIKIDKYRSVIDFLDGWQCPIDLDFAGCANLLADDLERQTFLSSEDSILLKAWTDHLSETRYKFPDRKSISDQVGQPISNRSVSYIPNGGDMSTLMTKVQSIEALSSFCSEHDITSPQSIKVREITHFEDVVLVITFNHPHHANIPLLLTLFRPWFANVIFCSTFDPHEQTESALFSIFGHWSLANISYVNVSREEMGLGAYSYICLGHVISMDLRNIRGYLVIGDDVLLNFWTFLDTSRIGFHFGSCETVVDFPSLWWFSDYGDTAVRKIRAMLHSERDRLRLTMSPNATRILKNVLLKPQWCASDIYYIPKDKTLDFRIMAFLFRRAQSFLEIAVPKIIASLGLEDRYELVAQNTSIARQEQDDDIKGKYLWTNRDRARPFKVYDEKKHFVHPFKLSKLNETRWKEAFCRRYVASLFEGVCH